jgi:hypothetical protein
MIKGILEIRQVSTMFLLEDSHHIAEISSKEFPLMLPKTLEAHKQSPAISQLIAST